MTSYPYQVSLKILKKTTLKQEQNVNMRNDIKR